MSSGTSKIVKMKQPPSDIKERVNQMLLLTLPGSATLDELEFAATAIYDGIMGHWTGQNRDTGFSP